MCACAKSPNKISCECRKTKHKWSVRYSDFYSPGGRALGYLRVGFLGPSAKCEVRTGGSGLVTQTCCDHIGDIRSELEKRLLLKAPGSSVGKCVRIRREIMV